MFRSREGFASPLRWFALGDGPLRLQRPCAADLFVFILCMAPRGGVGLRPAWRLFRLLCRRLRTAFGFGFGRPRGVGCGPSRFALVLVVRGGFVLSPLCSAPRVSRHRQQSNGFAL